MKNIIKKESDKMENTSEYTLRRKNMVLIRFVLETEQEVTNGIEQTIYKIHITEINEKNRHLFPYMLRENLTNRTLQGWIERRKAPKNRQFVEQIMHAIADDQNPLRYVDISHALSLNDAFWITNDAVPALWKDFNLYSHPFNEVLAYVAFTGYSKNRKDGIYLIKGDDFLTYSPWLKPGDSGILANLACKTTGLTSSLRNG